MVRRVWWCVHNVLCCVTVPQWQFVVHVRHKLPVVECVACVLGCACVYMCTCVRMHIVGCMVLYRVWGEQRL